MLRPLFFVVVLLCSLVCTNLSASSVAAEEILVTPLIISEVRLGGKELSLDETTKLREYVTLYNSSESVIQLEGWRLEYAKSSFDSQYCEKDNWSDYASSTIASVTELSGDLDPKSISSPISRQLNDTGSGSLRLVYQSDSDEVAVSDLIGWGTEAPCVEAEPANPPSINSTSNSSISRYLSCEDDSPMDSNNNLKDFSSATSHPNAPSEIYQSACTQLPDDQDEQVPSCEGIIITEIMPNPAGTDKGNEFIELYNPLDTSVHLHGCILKTTYSTKQYQFPEGEILFPGEYRAFYDSVTGLTLPNSAGGEVLLIGTVSDFLIQYPAAMKDNHSWAYIEGSWSITNQATPDEKNVLSKEIKTIQDEEAKVLSACPPGKYRSPETNRCRNIQVVTSALTPCSLGQVRNTETNRCRNIATIVSSLVPCKAGQERNPETNRCRNVLSASTAQATCKDGYERNPETNRCRKSAIAASSSPSVGSSPENRGNGSLDYTFIIAATFVVLGYGAYEYRRDFANAVIRFKSWQAVRKATK